jgi:NADH dehydrogenase/NADH:ubiquinone oxidoreductase subunit G
MQDDNAAHATVVIPTTAHYERDGHFVGTTGKLHESRRGVAAPRGAIDIHAALAHMALNAGKPLDNFQQTAVREDAVSVMGRGEADHA